MDFLGILGSLASILSLMVSAAEYIVLSMRSNATGHNRTNRGSEPDGVMLRQVSRTRSWNLGFFRSTVNEEIYEERVRQRHENFVFVSSRGVQSGQKALAVPQKTVAMGSQANIPVAGNGAKELTGRSLQSEVARAIDTR